MGISLYYEEQGQGEPIFLLHGNGEDGALYDGAVCSRLTGIDGKAADSDRDRVSVCETVCRKVRRGENPYGNFGVDGE